MSRRVQFPLLSLLVWPLACATHPGAPPVPAPAPSTPAFEHELGPTPRGEARLPAAAVAVRPVVAPAPVARPAPVPEPASATPVPSAVPQDLAFPEEPFRARQPVGGPKRPFRLPGLKRFFLRPLGIEVFLVERRSLPTVSMSLVFPGGQAADAPGKEGTAELCMQLLAEGTRRLDKVAFAEAQADLASSLSAWASTDEQGIRMSALSRHLDDTLDLWAEMLFEPGLRKEDLERLVRRRVESLKQSKGQVASVASRLMGLVNYGPAHALGRLETEASFQAVRVEDCPKHHARWLRPLGARLYVVGDIDEEGLRARLLPRLARPGWRGRPAGQVRLGNARPLAGRVFFVGIPGSAQSAIQIMHRGPRRDARDYVPTTLMAAVLGGGFSGRLNMNLREDKGWAYGARGAFQYHRQGSTFVAGASVQTEHTRAAVLEILRELDRLHTGAAPVSDAELKREQDGTILALPSSFATAHQVLAQYQELVYHGLPLDYYDRLVPAIAATTAEDVARAARTHLLPGEVRVLVAGDPAQVLPQLHALVDEGALPPGALVVLDADGRPMDAAASLAP